jgi:hypothetical protein
VAGSSWSIARSMISVAWSSSAAILPCSPFPNSSWHSLNPTSNGRMSECFSEILRVSFFALRFFAFRSDSRPSRRPTSS